MQEYKVSVRLRNISIKKWNYNKFYGNCQICNEKYSQEFIEGSYNNNRAIFVFCKDCYLVVNDICSEFKLNGISYQYERVYNINNLHTKKIRQPFQIMIPIVFGNKVMF
jgi:hypothetical protein